MVNTFKTSRKAWCPNEACAALLNGVTQMSQNGVAKDVKKGDITVCAYCGTICVYVTRAKLREATEVDLKDLEPKVRDAVNRASFHFARAGLEPPVRKPL